MRQISEVRAVMTRGVSELCELYAPAAFALDLWTGELVRWLFGLGPDPCQSKHQDGKALNAAFLRGDYHRSLHVFDSGHIKIWAVVDVISEEEAEALNAYGVGPTVPEFAPEKGAGNGGDEVALITLLLPNEY